jgi:hypothetical protein
MGHRHLTTNATSTMHRRRGRGEAHSSLGERALGVVLSTVRDAHDRDYRLIVWRISAPTATPRFTRS